MYVDVDSFWQCDSCGYANAGSDRCMACDARGPLGGPAAAPRSATFGDEAGGEAEPDAEGDAVWSVRDLRKANYGTPKVSQKVKGRTAVRTVVTFVAVQIVFQTLVAFAAVGAGVDEFAVMQISMLSGLAYDVLVVLFVRARSVELGLQPLFVRGGRAAAVGLGVLVGGAEALGFTVFWRLVEGRPVVDEMSAAWASEGLLVFFLGLLLTVVGAPIVEEYLFRGVFVEALRRRGPFVAILCSSAAFSLAHLQFAQFRYFLLGGIVLGVVYWRRGLVASIAAHAAFNGALALFALAVVTGPATQVEMFGSRLELPGNWRPVEVAGSPVAATGPSGALLEIVRLDVPAAPSATDLARAVGAGTFAAVPELSVKPGSVAVTELPAGSAVWFEGYVGWSTGEVVMLPRGSAIWVATMASGGSDRAHDDFKEIVESWRVP